MNQQEVLQFLKDKDNFHIISHGNPDGDTLGSGIALCHGLRQMGKRANHLCADEIVPSFSYLFEGYLPQEFEAKCFVTVDTADKKLLGAFAEVYDVIDLSIDHHVSGKPFAKQTYLVASASSTCEIVYDLIMALPITITKEIATGLFTGLVTDTGYFRQENATVNGVKAGAHLMECGVDHHTIGKIHFGTVSKNYLQLESVVVQDGEYLFEESCVFMAVTLDMMQQYSVENNEIDRLTALMLQISGVHIGVLFKQKEEHLFKVSVRTDDTYSANEICKHFGGGGHKRASGCAIEGSLQEVKEKMKQVIETQIKE